MNIWWGKERGSITHFRYPLSQRVIVGIFVWKVSLQYRDLGQIERMLLIPCTYIEMYFGLGWQGKAHLWKWQVAQVIWKFWIVEYKVKNFGVQVRFSFNWMTDSRIKNVCSNSKINPHCFFKPNQRINQRMCFQGFFSWKTIK